MRTKQYRVDLSDEERARLLLLTRQGRAPVRTVLRAHILLRASEGALDGDTAVALHTSVNTVQRVRRRYAEEGLGRAVYDRTRPGGTPKLDAKGEATLRALACGKPPDGRTVWTMQMLADKLVELHVIDSISDESVRRTLGKMPARVGAGRPRTRCAGGGGHRGPRGRRTRPLRGGGERP